MTEIEHWMNAHKLKINTRKTEILLFHPKQLKNDVIIRGTHFGEHCIRFSPTVKNVGVFLDEHLSMDRQVNSIVSQCYLSMKNIGRIKSVLSSDHLRMLVSSLVLSRIDYCNCLYVNSKKDNLYKLQKTQNSAARLIEMKNRRQLASPLLKILHWLPVNSRNTFKYLLIAFKIIKGLIPYGSLQINFKKYNTRPDDYLKLQNAFPKTKYGKRTFEHIAPNLWNNLPLELRSLDEVFTFKRKLKTFLFGKADFLNKSMP